MNRAMLLRPRGLSFLSIGLLIASVYIVAVGLAQVAVAVERSLFVSMAILGALAGLVVGSIAFSKWHAVLISGLVGLAVVILRVGGVGPQLAQVLERGVVYSGTVQSTWFLSLTGFSGEAEFAQAVSELAGALGVLVARTSEWLRAWFLGQPTFDPVAAALVWSVLIWVASTWAGWWFQAKKRPLIGLIPAVGMAGVALGSIGAKADTLVWSLGVAIIAVTLVGQDVREARWRRIPVSFGSGLRRSLILWVVLLSLGLMAAGALSQVISYRKIAQALNRYRTAASGGDGLSRQALGLEQSDAEPPEFLADLVSLRYPGLPRRHLIGSGPELSEQLVLSIQVNEELKRPGLEIGGPAARYYWRSNTYDFYIGSGWVAGRTVQQEYEAGERLRENVPLRSRAVDQTVRSIPELGGLLFSAGPMVTVDQPFAVAWRSPEDDFGAVLVTPATRARIISYVPDATEEELRGSGSDYPDWVAARYLQLPSSLPDRVIALSRRLTATSPTPYDRALEIESFLRTFAYTLDLEAPPADRDVVDYFLFDLKKGYCDYYASAMVVLSRAAGMPARLVTGYFTGTYNAQLNAYLVTAADAHSWPEIYFPGYGWIEFEPTRGRPALDRDESTPLATSLDRSLPEEIASVPTSANWAVLAKLAAGILLAGLFAVLVVGSVWTLAGAVRTRRLSPSAAIARVFMELRGHAVVLGLISKSGETPYELSASLSKALVVLQSDPQNRILSQAPAEIQELARLYVRASYSPYQPNQVDRVQALAIWRRLRWRLWWVRVLRKLPARPRQ